jgi:type IX secretion system PorP/SprF family membrane protein
MKKKILTLSALFAFSMGVSYGQQDRLMTHFIYDKMSVNPAVTGMEEGICGTMLYRNQWDKVNGAPNSFVLNGEANLYPFNHSGGAGVTFYHDAIGFARQNNAVLNYSYHVRTDAGTLGIGAAAGITNLGMDPLWIPPQPGVVDNLLPGAIGGTSVDFNFGLYWKAKRYYAGISSTHLSQSEIKNINYTTARHYYLMAGYNHPIGQNNLDVQMMMRTDMVKFSMDFNARYIVNNQFYGGLTYRTSDAVAAMLGFKVVDKLSEKKSKFSMWAGYSYDFTVNKLSSISQGTHELMVRGCYILPPPPIQKSKHPRWL